MENKKANFCISNLRYKIDFSIFDLTYKDIIKN